MNRIGKITCAGLAALATLFSMARADIASGSYTVEFDGNVSIWDVSGSYSEDIGGLTIDYTLSVDPSGKITGYGSANVSDYGVGANLDFNFSGTVKSSGSVTRVTLNMTAKGSGTYDVHTLSFRASMKETMEVDTVACAMTGTVSGNVSVSVQGMGKQSQKIPTTDLTLDLPVDMDGSWDLTVNTTTNGTKVTGTGQLTLSNGTTYGFSVTGSYATKTDLAKLTLKGGTANKAMSANVTANFSSAGMNVKMLKGKALGQNITYCN